MKVNGRDETAPARPASDKGHFKEVLRRTGAEAAKPPDQGVQGSRPPTPSARPTTPTGAQATTGTRPIATTLSATAALATGALRTPVRGTIASAEHLGQVRQGLHVEAHRLGDVRGESHQTNQERVQQRVTDLLSRELARELRAEPAPRVPPAQPSPESPTPPPQQVEALSPAGEARAGGAAEAAAVEAPNPEARVQAALELIEKIDVFVRSQRPALALRLGGALDATVEVERTGAREVSLRIQGHRGPLPQEDLARIREALADRGLKLSALLSA